jgi:cytochrome c-type biogenesis protein CcmF
LSDFSVHSFSSLGRDGFELLGGWVAAAFVIPIALVIARARIIPKAVTQSRLLTREVGYVIASAVFGTLGFITAVGMSAPIITKLWIPKGAATQPDFYNHATFPLTILMLIGMAATPYLAWKDSDAATVGKRLLPAYIGAIALTVVVFFLGARKPWMLLLFAFAAFAAVANLLLLAKAAARPVGRPTLGGFLAHIGAAMLLIGIVFLVTFSRQALHVALVKDMPQNVLGYQLTYLGTTSQPYDRKNAVEVRVEKDGKSWVATPHYYVAPWGGMDQLFADPPDIRNFPWGDLYLALYRPPSSLNTDSPNNGMTMTPGDQVNYFDYKFVYHGLKWADDVHKAMTAQDPQALGSLPQMRLHALVDVTYNGRTYPVHPVLVFDRIEQSKYSIPAPLPGALNAILTLNDAQLPSEATLTTSNLPDPLDMVQVDLSTKPLIWLVWMGTLLYTIGGLIAYRRRAREFTMAAK